MKFPSDFILFAGPKEAVEAAKKYIHDNGYTKEDVCLVIVGDDVLVRVK